MFKSKPSLQDTLSKVKQFVADLKAGIEKHQEEVNFINEEINSLYEKKDELKNEIFNATKLIGTLSGDNN